MLQHMITVSDGLPGYTITENLGVVSGIAIRTKTIDIMATWHIQTLLGRGNIAFYKYAHKARSIAFDEMIRNAENLGADAIICVKFESNEIAKNSTEIFCYGSAVKVIKNTKEEL